MHIWTAFFRPIRFEWYRETTVALRLHTTARHGLIRQKKTLFEWDKFFTRIQRKLLLTRNSHTLQYVDGKVMYSFPSSGPWAGC